MGDLCRSIPLVYQKDIVSNGVPGFRFVPPDDVFSPPDENPDNECYCNNKECNVPRGLFNMTACSFASPIFMSWPHFYQICILANIWLTSRHYSNVMIQVLCCKFHPLFT